MMHEVGIQKPNLAIFEKLKEGFNRQHSPQENHQLWASKDGCATRGNLLQMHYQGLQQVPLPILIPSPCKCKSIL